MRMLGPFCFCALFVAGMWAFEAFGWAAESKSVEGLSWRNPVAAGKTLTVRNINGPITVIAASGGDAEVRAEVHYRRSDPKDIRFQVKSDERGATTEVNAATVNGDVRVISQATPLRAETVNGKVAVRVRDLEGDGAIRLATVNGDISAELPARFDAEVTARTVSGTISILGKEYQERVRTTVGRGGHKVSAQNVNGSIAIR